MDYAPLRSHGLLNKNLSARYMVSSYKSLLKVAPDTLKTVQAFVIALGYQPELDGKSQLLKTPRNLAIGYKGRKSVPQGAMQTAGGE